MVAQRCRRASPQL